MPTDQSREDQLIETLFARHSADGAGVLIGPGDDAAMVRCPEGEELLITTDTLNEGVHFPRGIPAHAIGHRALAVSLSDLAAMGARPLWAVVALSCPAEDEWWEGVWEEDWEEDWEDWLARFADGLYELADANGVRIVGGDFVRGPLSITVTAHGSARREAAVRRRGGGAGASEGDGIWVSGTLGDAAAGLCIIEHRRRRDAARTGLELIDQLHIDPKYISPEILNSIGAPLRPSAAETLVRRFCYPEPRVELGRQLSGIASACLDLSDGLSEDLNRLLRGKPLQARIEAERLPISGALRDYDDAHETTGLAVWGGDDYELCFTVPPENEHRLESLFEQHPLTRVGTLRPGEGVRVTLGGKQWRPRMYDGFRHFS